MIRHRMVAAIAAIALLLTAQRTRAAESAPPPKATPTPQSQEAPVVAGDAAPVAEGNRGVHFSGEVKAHFRNSTFVEEADKFPFPSFFLPPGETQVFLRTVARGSSFEISTATLRADATLTPQIHAGLQVNVLDLYDRNPTSSDDRISLRQAWLRFGQKQEPLEEISGKNLYVQIGKAPRFTKQINRNLESYGLWGTAVGRFEEIGLEAGASFGKYLYVQGAVANGNPLFFRDPNVLAGDNGTPERQPSSTTRPISGTYPIYESGFPIMYDAKAQDLNTSRSFQSGLGLGVRWSNTEKRSGLDMLAWRFQRKLQDRPAIRGSFYLGDLTLLSGVLFPLATEGRDKVEYGLNIQAKHKDLHLFAQAIHQDIAGLVRKGVEIEASLFVPLRGAFASGDTPVLTWIRPVFRFSNIVNDFTVSPQFPAPSIGWNWRKYDFGLRAGIIRDVDITAEYSFHQMLTPATRHPNEFLVTFRAGF